jgi:hypothetical protein
MLQLIAVTGFAGAGKDSVRAVLEKYGYIGLAFADPMKAMLGSLYDMCGVDKDHMHARELKEKCIPAFGKSYREMAQALGTEWARELDPDFWVKVMGARLDDMLVTTFGTTKFVISDLRFLNEAAWVKSRGGTIWRVDRPIANPVRHHVSETEQTAIQADVTIYNHGTLDDLDRIVLETVNG